MQSKQSTLGGEGEVGEQEMRTTGMRVTSELSGCETSGIVVRLRCGASSFGSHSVLTPGEEGRGKGTRNEDHRMCVTSWTEMLGIVD